MEEKLTTLFQTIDEVTLHLSEEPEIAASIRESGNRGRSAVYAKLYEETASLREMAQFDLYSEEGVCLYSKMCIRDSLSLIERFAVRVRESQHFSGRTHLRP